MTTETDLQIRLRCVKKAGKAKAAKDAIERR